MRATPLYLVSLSKIPRKGYLAVSSFTTGNVPGNSSGTFPSPPPVSVPTPIFNPPHHPLVPTTWPPKPFRNALSWLHLQQIPFNMRQLKEMPFAVANTIDSVPTRAAALPRLRVGKLCIAVQGATPTELLARAEAASKDSVFIEFRLDFLAKPAAALPELKAFLARRRDITSIATCRRKSFGGKFTGSLNSELEHPSQSRPNRLPHRRSRSRVGRAVYPPATGQVPRRPPRRRYVPPDQFARLHPHPPPGGPQPNRPAHRRFRA